MAFRQMFFVQVYDLTEALRLTMGQRYEADDFEHAKLKARSLALKSDGVVAFSQMVDAATGDSEEPELVAVHGAVPIEARESIFSHSGVTDYARPRACNL